LVDYCIECGKALKKDAEFCIYCSKKVINYKETRDISPTNIQADSFSKRKSIEKKERADSKKESRYILNDAQRETFLYKVLPLLVFGCLIWLFGGWMLNFIFFEVNFTIEFIIIYIILISGDMLAYILFFITSRKNYVLPSMFFYIIFAYLAGAISLPIIVLNSELSKQVLMFIFANFEGTIVIALLGYSLRKRYLEKGNLLVHIFLYFLFIAIAEILFFLVFRIENWILTLSITLPYMLIVSLIILFYGARVIKKEDTQPWPYILFKILRILLISLLLAIVVVIAVLIIIGLAIICGDGDFDISGLSFGGSGRRKKKKNTI